ncbi:Beta-D-glucosidase protein [Spatholobus suberectus]|nr:Beta-D-glucosidase protein [Spatholobus suberectus]
MLTIWVINVEDGQLPDRSLVAMISSWVQETRIVEPVYQTVDPATEVVYNENPEVNFVKSNKFSYGIVVVREHTSTETFGDSLNLTMAEPGPSTITKVCVAIQYLVALITGWPVVIQPYLSIIDVLVVAWFPGAEGDYEFTGKLARTWFKTVDQLPMLVINIRCPRTGRFSTWSIEIVN